jgi:magnesium transporter
MSETTEFRAPISDAPWIDLQDPMSPALDRVAEEERFHPLEVEDCRHRHQIAKVVESEAYTFVVIKVIRFNPETLELDFEDFDLFVTRERLVTVQEGGCGRLIERVVRRMQAAPARMRPWRLVHALLDEVVDDYLPVLDAVGTIINELEDLVLEEPSPETLQRIFALKRALIEFRRNATAMREVLNALLRMAPPGEERYLLLRDVYDHVVRTLDFVETYRDLVSGSLDIYLSSIANRTNDIVKVLTIYGTVALPLIVITGFYGMNLDLPLQHSAHGLLMVAALMALSTGGIMLYFWKRGWL